MKYFLIIVIFGSFLFSQASVTNYDNSVTQVEALDGSGNSFNPVPDNATDMQNLLSEDSNYNSQTEEYNENGRSINPIPNDQGNAQILARKKESNYNSQAEEYNENSHSINPVPNNQ